MEEGEDERSMEAMKDKTRGQVKLNQRRKDEGNLTRLLEKETCAPVKRIKNQLNNPNRRYLANMHFIYNVFFF